ncbi:hypothetical protein Bhyg_05851 [Pseudolycoriella hygida]|uniref:Uncharacterized protein n=1 Tax=Pseudolycoriella hygida TaxID=35572 RepID=A0A9Q0S1V8_9DIPT|nr:hypothetical protein Bhyg_05851 [Pseudolycoriella hygida]
MKAPSTETTTTETGQTLRPFYFYYEHYLVGDGLKYSAQFEFNTIFQQKFDTL